MLQPCCPNAPAQPLPPATLTPPLAHGLPYAPAWLPYHSHPAALTLLPGRPNASTTTAPNYTVFAGTSLLINLVAAHQLLIALADPAASTLA